MSTILSAAEIEARAKQAQLNSKAYLSLEVPIRELAHMAGITAVVVEKVLDEVEPRMEDGEVIIRMSERQHEQLLFAIDKVCDMAVEIDKTYHAR